MTANAVRNATATIPLPREYFRANYDDETEADAMYELYMARESQEQS